MKEFASDFLNSCQINMLRIKQPYPPSKGVCPLLKSDPIKVAYL